jgi:transposase
MELDRDHPDWRETHILMLDNCSSHKTQLMRKIMSSTGFRVLFTAPASYLVPPVEGIFAIIKTQKLDDITTPALLIVKRSGVTKLTNKQRVQIKIADYIKRLDTQTVKRVFHRALYKLPHLLVLRAV